MAFDLRSGESAAEPPPLAEINTTPLIDVMLVLLIMLIISLPLQTHAVKLDMPSGPPPLVQTKPERVSIAIDFDGTVLWNGQVVTDRAALEDRLRTAAAASPQPEIHLRPHRLASYRHVAAVLASAQRLGLARIGVVGSEQFTP